MKTDMKHIENEVRKTMASLDHIQKANPKPYLYTRIMARLENADLARPNALELKPVYQRLAMFALALILIFNVFTATLYLGGTSETTSETSQEEIYFEDYYPSLTTIDNIEQNLNE